MPDLFSSSEIIRVLEKHGFILVSQRGSHKKFKKEGRIVIVHDPKKEIPKGTFESILRQSGLNKEDFETQEAPVLLTANQITDTQ